MQALLAICDESGLEDALMQQGHILNQLLRQTLDKSAGPALTDSSLAMMLRTQRECRQTIAALSRMRVTNAKVRAVRGELPGSGKSAGKRNDSGRNDSDSRLYNSEGRLIYDFSGID